ncbi:MULTISPECIES: efflux RND transporter periplasmic adaptor subunit [Ferrimonas]|uniref:efflux RND transporter periplasmic adaptor subunit n=1 Tax=Ferrimonas TaxID=44011 RepID=UPI000412D8E1|nr:MULTISPECIES: efflux RND transporter periplasmic adaptor subunit [Ferrimonas]USD38961.1 efflux RND transporter periplasmic adaptor subunit [Ferrimonas sp. SCSIO 43195]
MNSLKPLLFSLPLLLACSPEPQPQRAAAVRPVKLFTITDAQRNQVYEFPAVVDASRDAALSFQVSGLLKELNIIEAQQVQEGELLAKLDQRDFLNKLASAQAEYDNAEREYRRLEQVASKGLISQSDLTKQLSARDIAKANLGIAQKALDDSVLHAPFSGTIAQVPVINLQNITAGELVAKLIDTQELEVNFNVPSRLIKSGQPPKVEVIINADPERRYTARFKEIGLIADPSSQTYPVTWLFTPPKGKLILPGMLATVEASPPGAGSTTLAIPLEAVQQQGTQTYVWLYQQQSGSVIRRDIQVSDGVGDLVPVSAGLAIGDTIVAAGGAYLAEGMEVKPWQD